MKDKLFKETILVKYIWMFVKNCVNNDIIIMFAVLHLNVMLMLIELEQKHLFWSFYFCLGLSRFASPSQIIV